VSWAVRYLVVDTSSWCSGNHVVVAPGWISEISWCERAVSVDMTRLSMKSAPPYDRSKHLDRQWELEYYQHLKQPGYLLSEEEARAINEAQSYLRDEPDRNEVSVERRSRP
jgi:hypothetical protein